MLKDCIASEFANTKQMKELFDVEEKELERIYLTNEKLFNELFVGLAEELIKRYEKEYALKEDNTASLKSKRARILAKKNSKIIPTISNFEKAIKALLNAEDVIISEKINELLVYVKTPELVENMSIAKEWLHYVRPAHMAYRFINELKRTKESKIHYGFKTFIKKKERVVV